MGVVFISLTHTHTVQVRGLQQPGGLQAVGQGEPTTTTGARVASTRRVAAVKKWKKVGKKWKWRRLAAAGIERTRPERTLTALYRGSEAPPRAPGGRRAAWAGRWARRTL